MSSFRPTDDVLDVGCAEGMIALELAKSVKHVHGIELEAHKVAKALEFAAERGCKNFTARRSGSSRRSLRRSPMTSC